MPGQAAVRRRAAFRGGMRVALAAALGLAAAARETSDGASLQYTVTLDSPDSQRVTVSAELEGLDPDRSSLSWRMQERFAFIRLPKPLLEGPVRASAGGEPLELTREAPHEWTLATGGRESVRLEWVVPLNHRELEAVQQRDAYEYPYVAEDHGMLVTPALFLHPEGIPEGEIRVRFELPEGWEVLAPWREVSDRVFDPGDGRSLVHDLVAIGAWSVHTIRVGEFEGSIAFAPGQEVLEAAAVEPIRRIVEHELELFGLPAQGRYLFLFGRPETRGLAGSPKTRSMTLSVEPRLAALAPGYIPHLIAHEFFHTWAASRMELPDELRWVSEGFTDYYAYLVPARLGLAGNTWQDFGGTLADKMMAYQANPLVGRQSLAGAGGPAFFSDQWAYHLVYDGGLLLAAWLDRRIRAEHPDRSLDDLMRSFTNDPRWGEDGARPGLADFIATAARYAGEEAAERLRGFAAQPGAFDPVEELNGVGVEVSWRSAPPTLSLRANLDGTRLVDIDTSGLAFRLGIRAGDRLIEVNGREVTDPGEVHRAWREPVENRVRVVLERGGVRTTIDEPIPEESVVEVSIQPWLDDRDRTPSDEGG